MENNPNQSVSPEDDLKASNELLKLKLELEHGMEIGDSHSLTAEAENKWLNYIYTFEQQYKEARTIKVYDFIERPHFDRYDVLSEEKVSDALARILSIMNKKGLALDCCCKYEDVVIYRFITEELFEHEIDDITVEGMIHHFIYEEFHPNHDYDLRKRYNDFIESVLHSKWNEQFDALFMTDSISFNAGEYSSAEISSIILAFQESHASFNIKDSNINRVEIDLENMTGLVEARLAYYAHRQGVRKLYEGTGTMRFSYELGEWCISSFRFPGLGL